jgi:hypothetical protein
MVFLPGCHDDRRNGTLPLTESLRGEGWLYSDCGDVLKVGVGEGDRDLLPGGMSEGNKGLDGLGLSFRGL